ncbi:MAG: DUF4932 domain-containing protein [Acidobacteriota bacterium]
MQIAKPVRQKPFFIAPKVDRRVELLSIVARLAEFEEYSGNDFKLYVDEVNRHFAKYKQHAVVQQMLKVRQQNGVGFDAVMNMAVHLSPPPELAPRVAFTDKIPDRRWGKADAEEFTRLLRQFYKDADCENFFKAHSELYNTAEQRFQQLLNKVDFDWYKRFYGEVPGGTFNLYIGLLNGGGNYGPKVVHPKGEEDLYAIIGTWQMDKEGMPLYNERLLSTIIHEFNHSFINHLVYANEAALKNAGEKIYPPVREKMQKLAYGNWQVMMLESLVRAAVARYLFEHEQESANKEVIQQRNIGFLWMSELFALLGAYENNRASYPTFRSFMPMVIGYFNDYAKRITLDAKNFEDLTPRVASLAPFANGAQDVDPTITRLTFTFDKPLDPKGGVSINFGEGGREHFPITKVVGYNETGTTFTVEMQLKPDWQYEFALTGIAFKTRDGYPLQPYTVKFKTRK